MKLWIWFFLFGTVYAGDAEMKKSYVRDMSIPPDFSLVPACYGKVANEDCPLIQHVQEGIEQASREMGRLSLEVLKIDGMTSAKGRYLLNHLCSLPNAVYLEIGSWKGSSFVSALYHNEGLRKSYAIEKWVRFADNGFDFGDVRDEFYANVRAHLQGLSFKIFENDCFSLNLDEIPEKITIYFYDGEHRKKDQKEAFIYFNDRLASEFIAIVDDWNWESTRSGTFEAFDQLGYKVLFEQYLPANFDGDTANWWNGMYVAVIRKSK